MRGGFLGHLNNSERERKREGKSEREVSSFGRLHIYAVKPKRAPSSKTWSDHVGAHFGPVMTMCTDKSCSWPGVARGGIWEPLRCHALLFRAETVEHLYSPRFLKNVLVS